MKPWKIDIIHRASDHWPRDKPTAQRFVWADRCWPRAIVYQRWIRDLIEIEIYTDDMGTGVYRGFRGSDSYDYLGEFAIKAGL